MWVCCFVSPAWLFLFFLPLFPRPPFLPLSCTCFTPWVLSQQWQTNNSLHSKCVSESCQHTAGAPRAHGVELWLWLHSDYSSVYVSNVDRAVNYWVVSAGWLLISFKTQTGSQASPFMGGFHFDFRFNIDLSLSFIHARCNFFSALFLWRDCFSVSNKVYNTPLPFFRGLLQIVMIYLPVLRWICLIPLYLLTRDSKW